MEIFKIGEHYLDEYQKEIVLDDSKSLLVVAGAGSGKTFTILGKVKYLIEVLKIKKEEILLLSLTNDTVNNLKNKLNDLGYTDFNVYTFHKLGLNILKTYKTNINIVSDDYLSFIIDEYVMSYIFNNKNAKHKFIRYFRFNIFKNLSSNKEYINFKNMISSAIHLIKSCDYNIDNIYEFYSKSWQDKMIWKVILDIFIIYKRELDSLGLIDFDDMINESYKLVRNQKINLKYKYIIIDEFQDMSMSKYYLIKEIINLSDAKLVAVGDDWQSIYGFTGCEVEILINFKKYFDDAKILFLKNTYRNSQELINVASSFILKNKNQISKELISNKRCQKPIKIIYANSNNILEKVIKFINKKDVMILGRNNYDIKSYNYNNACYLTVHKSKGLEADEVILINLENKIDGFPNKKKDYKILNRLKNNPERFKYAEERRLFYVALTRTKNNVYLIVPKTSKSIFIKELLRDYKQYIEILKI